MVLSPSLSISPVNIIFGFSLGLEDGDLDAILVAEEGVRCWRREGVEEGVPEIT